MGLKTVSRVRSGAGRLLAPVQYAVVAFALTAAQTGGQYAPWSLGWIAAVGAGSPGLFSLIGTAVGSLFFFPFQPGLRHTAAALLIYCAAAAFYDTGFYRKNWFRPGSAGVLFLLIQSVYLWGQGIVSWLSALAAALAAALSAVLLRFLLSREKQAGSAPPEKPDQAALQQSAQAFRSLYDSLFSPLSPTSAENPSVIFDRAAQKVCRDCQRRDICWQQGYTTTYNAFNDACPALLQRKTALPEDFPSHFSEQCLAFPTLLEAINQELQVFLLRRQYRRRLQNTRDLAAAQYARIGEILSSAHLTVPAAATPTLSYRVATALRPREGESACGDQLSHFTYGSTAYFLLSDGMGSGEAAHAESAMTVRLLKQFLTAGIEALPALRTLNTALSLRGTENGGFTTIDLLALDLQSGQAVFYKYGAAPSYLKRNGKVIPFRSHILPAGLAPEDAPAPEQHLLLQGGEWMVMVSDGVAGEENDDWLMDLLAGFSPREPELLCAHIMAESRRHGGLSDDCAVIALRTENLSPDSSIGEV